MLGGTHISGLYPSIEPSYGRVTDSWNLFSRVDMQPFGCLSCDGVDDEVFRALADPSRRQLLDRLNAANGQTLRQLCDGLTMARQSVSKHLAVLESAGLITTTRRGREKLHYLNAEPINAIADRWLGRYTRARASALADLKTALEHRPMTTTEFAYTTYVKTTPERLWEALTTPEFTRRYWGVSLESTWEVGAPVTWGMGEVRMDDPTQQVVLESKPYERLSYTWHTLTDEFAAAVGLTGEKLAAWRAEPRSKVTFSLEPMGELVKLTVIHDDFMEGSAILPEIGKGWPAILSNLKTYLETGETLPTL